MIADLENNQADAINHIEANNTKFAMTTRPTITIVVELISMHIYNMPFPCIDFGIVAAPLGSLWSLECLRMAVLSCDEGVHTRIAATIKLAIAWLYYLYYVIGLLGIFTDWGVYCTSSGMSIPCF